MVSSLVGSVYNIVDQIFVGNSVGELGNTATNVDQNGEIFSLRALTKNCLQNRSQKNNLTLYIVTGRARCGRL